MRNIRSSLSQHGEVKLTRRKKKPSMAASSAPGQASQAFEQAPYPLYSASFTSSSPSFRSPVGQEKMEAVSATSVVRPPN